MSIKNTKENEIDLGDKKSYSGIPEAEFVNDVDAYMQQPGNDNVDKVLKKLEDLHAKYKLMEYNLMQKRRRLRLQLPDLTRTLEMIDKLKTQQDDLETEFLLSEDVFVKAKIPPTQTVYLWLGANVMLEYSLEDAQDLLNKNMKAANKNLSCVEYDLDFLRDQLTTTEVNIARVFNWDVKRRQAAKAT